MSLLLDALKKAAEQKAQKGKSEAPQNRSSDETVLDAEAVDETARLAADDRPRSAGREDETILEQTEIEERLARGERIAGDDTSLDIEDSTQTQLESGSPAAGVDDETSIDMPDTTQTLLVDEPPEQVAADETSIDVADTTQTLLVDEPPEQVAADETSIDVADTTQTLLVDEPPEQVAIDETSIDVVDTTESVFEQGQATESDSVRSADPAAQMRRDEDETIVFGSDDVADFAADSELDSRRPVSREDVTDVEQRKPGIDAPADSLDNEPDDDTTSRAGDGSDEDLSLMLQDPDPTATGVDTSFTDPRTLGKRARDLSQGDQELALADITQDRATPDQTDTEAPTLTNPTATAMHGEEGLAAPTRTNLASADNTSTRTYAPDNYDRTLMKLPSDDASKLFAGMKPDADVVMTPDYAKKVFRSKNATQRSRHYQTYLGIALILFGLVVFYGAMEYQDESVQIENSLRPLKRDPMPGVIKAQREPEIDLFGESSGQVDPRTIEIIAGAADGVVAAEPEIETESVQVVEQEPVVDDTRVAVAEPTAAPNPPQSAATGIDANTDDASTRTSTSNAQGNLNIQSSSQYRQADVWLREAYEAYLAGNDQLAMQRYNQVLQVDPGNRDALLGHAAINVQNGNIDAAIRDYQTLLLVNPKDSLAMSSLLAIASYSPRETESQLKLMIQDEPNSPYLNFALANAYGAQDRWQEAQGYYFKALQNNPDDPNYAYNLAVSLEHISQPRTAITYYQRALDNMGNGLATFSREAVGQRLEVLGNL